MKKIEQNFNRDVILKTHEPTAKLRQFKNINLPKEFVEIDYSMEHLNVDFRKKINDFPRF